MAAPAVDDLFLAAREAFAESPFVELRLDALPEPAGAVEQLRKFCHANPSGAVLATCRTVAGGGAFAGSVAEQLQILESMAAAGATLVDVELETLEAAGPERLASLAGSLAQAGAALLVSAHDFKQTGDLESTLGRMRRLGAPARPAIYKVVSTAQGLEDNLSMLAFLEAASRQVPVVGLCMGEAGLASRVLALRSGALFTFASASGSSGTAPGQVAAKLLLDEYRAADLGPATRIFGVAGSPVGHSLSPALHNAGFRAAGIDAVYLPLLTNSVEGLMALVRGLPLSGVSVTMPWKVEVLPYLDEVDPMAARIGAVNTLIVRENGSIAGTNTDVPAILEPLRQRMTLKDARVLVLGAGGAARAAVFALRSEGALVLIWNRTPAKAEQLARETGAAVVDAAGLRGFAAVVQATPAGMQGQDFHDLPVGAAELEGVRVVFEMVYRPAETPLTRLAQSLGIEVISGLEMFALQGIRQWELWTGRNAPAAEMHKALESALHRQDENRTAVKENDMAKYDAVDRLMDLATDKPAPVKNEQARTVEESGEPDAIEVLAERVAATEPTLPEAARKTATLVVPRATPAERGRQLLGALRPFLPVVGGALRMIDHGAVQAVARLLPLLGSAPLPGLTAGPAPSPATSAEGQQALSDLLAAFDKRDTATAEELKAQEARLSAVEEQMRRAREAVERMSSEQGAQSNRLREVTDRARLLTAAVIILLMLAVAEMVLLLIFMHR